MAKVTPISEHFQHFLADLEEAFWGDLYGRTQAAWKQFLEADSVERRDRYAVREAYQRRRSRRQPYRNGYYERDFVTRLGTIRLRIARTRGKSFLPGGLERFQRRMAVRVWRRRFRRCIRGHDISAAGCTRCATS